MTARRSAVPGPSAARQAADRLIPLQGQAIELGFRVLLNGGMLALLGAVLIVPLCVPSRWRRRYRTDEFSGWTSTSLLQ